MTDSNQQASDFKDRTPGLITFGVVSILIGACCALLIPLSLIAAALSQGTGGGVDSRSAWAASAMYGFLAVAFVWLGVGSIRARRWACEILLSLSWIWLLTGICSLLLGILVIPAVVRQAALASEIPPELTSIVMLVIFGVIGFLYVVLPGAYVLFYRSPNVAETCRIRHPAPQWIDNCPRRLLTLMLLWVLLAASVLLMPAYNFIFPFFGLVLTDASGAGMWCLVLALCVILAAGTCRRALWAWWGGVALVVAAAISSSLVALRYDLTEIMMLMDLPGDQVSLIAGLGLEGGWQMALINAFVWGTFLAYLMTLRRFFKPTPVEADD
jgi:hypothetical protein